MSLLFFGLSLVSQVPSKIVCSGSDALHKEMLYEYHYPTCSKAEIKSHTVTSSHWQKRVIFSHIFFAQPATGKLHTAHPPDVPY